MLLALGNHLAKLAFAALLLLVALPNPCQSQSQLLLANAASSPALRPAPLDPAAAELLSLGSDGTAIQQARSEVLSILNEPNSCSEWFLAAEPAVVEKFRSLRFAIDEKGSGDIIKQEGAPGELDYYQPYVARTGQNVGWGSSIVLNRHGAFFRNGAPVLLISSSSRLGRYVAFRSLAVGEYPGSTFRARILTMLHELGHVVDLLPLDAGVPSGPLISVRNTGEVLHHCGAQIGARKKPSRKAENPPTLSASAPPRPDTYGINPKSRGASLW